MNYHLIAQVLKYSVHTVTNLLEQLHDNIYARVPQEGGTPESNPNTLQRLVTADALDDEGRSGESDLLRNLQQHVLIHEARVRPAKFRHEDLQSLRAARSSLHAAVSHVDPDHTPSIALLKSVISPNTHLSTHTSHPGSSYIEVPYQNIKDVILHTILSNIKPEQYTENIKNRIQELNNTPIEEVDTSYPYEKTS